MELCEACHSPLPAVGRREGFLSNGARRGRRKHSRKGVFCLVAIHGSKRQGIYQTAASDQKADPDNAKSWPRFILKVDRYMCNYLTSGKRTKLAILISSLKVWILLKVARGFARGAFEVKPFVDGKSNDDGKPVMISILHSAEARSYIPSSQLTVFPVKKWKAHG